MGSPGDFMKERELCTLLVEVGHRYPAIRLWMSSQGAVRDFTLVIVHPTKVRDEYHRIVHDLELRDRARPLIGKHRANDQGENTVLIVAPMQ